MSEEKGGHVGILMCAGCVFACLLLIVPIALTKVAIQNRRLVSCTDALVSAGVLGASTSTALAGGNLGADEETVSSCANRALAGLPDSTCRVEDGVSVSWISASSEEVEVSVRARPRVSPLPSVLCSAAVPELMRTLSARLCGVQGLP